MKKKETTTEPLPWKQAMMLLDAMKDKGKDNTRLMLACGFFFGLRIKDILHLTWEQILQDEFIIEESKTSKPRRIALDPKMKEIRDQVLSNLPDKPNGLIFVYQRRDGDKTKPISVTAANKRIKKTFDDYGIETKNPSSHTLRKTFGLRVYEVHNRCEDALILLSQMFNHSDISVTRRYIGITQRRIANAYTSLSSGNPDFENP